MDNQEQSQSQEKYSVYHSRPRRLKFPPILYIFIIIVIAGAASWYSYQSGKSQTSSSTATQTGIEITENGQGVKGYSAVFLTNNQVYFGKITRQDKDYTTLEDIYYIKGNNPQDSESIDEQKFDLIKLGFEIHNPKDKMKISNSQIVFIEELREDGQVAQKIKDYQEGKTQVSQPSTGQTTDSEIDQ